MGAYGNAYFYEKNLDYVRKCLKNMLSSQFEYADSESENRFWFGLSVKEL